MISFSTVEFDGHTYDAELLAAPLRVVQARATDRKPSRLTLVEKALTLRRLQVHGLVAPGRCSCGLVLPAGRAVDAVEGHLDFDTWLPAHALVVESAHEEHAYVAVCGCGWRESQVGPEPARGSLSRHLSDTAVRLGSATH